jgi:hypothetical protein
LLIIVTFSKSGFCATNAVNGDKAELRVLVDRTRTQRWLNDTAILFPDHIRTSPTCYQSAVSSYIEDKWNSVAKETGCVSDQGFCNKLAAEQENIGLGPDKRTQIVLANQQVIMAQLSSYLRPMRYHYTGMADASVLGNSITPEETLVRTGEVSKYITSCETLKAASWSIPGNPINGQDRAAITIAALKVGLYGMLLDWLLTHQLPKDKHPDVSCLSNYLRAVYAPVRNGSYVLDSCRDDKSCIETVPADTKEQLSQSLSELKQHGCTSSYAYEMTHR